MKIIPLIFYKVVGLCLGLILLAGCSSDTGVVSSFSQRKYTKGNFVNLLGEKPLVISHANSKEIDGVASDGIQHTIKESTSGLKDSVKTFNTYLKTAIAIAKKTDTPRPNNRITTYKQTSSAITKIADEPKQDNDARQKKNAGKVLMVLGVLLLLVSIILGSFISILIEMIVSAILFLILALGTNTQVVSKNVPVPVQNNNNNNVKSDQAKSPDTYDSNVGLLGFLLELGAMFIVYAGIISGVVVGVALGIVCIISFIIGFVFCIEALAHHDKNKIFAIIGVVIGAITLLPIVISLLAGLISI